MEKEKRATLINLAKNESEENTENFEIAKFKIAIDKLEKEKRESKEFSSTIVGLINELRDQKIPKLKQKVIDERHKLGRAIKGAMIEKIKLLAGDKVKMLCGICSVTGGASLRDLLLREIFPQPADMKPYHEKAGSARCGELIVKRKTLDIYIKDGIFKKLKIYKRRSPDSGYFCW